MSLRLSPGCYEIAFGEADHDTFRSPEACSSCSQEDVNRFFREVVDGIPPAIRPPMARSEKWGDGAGGIVGSDPQRLNAFSGASTFDFAARTWSRTSP